MDWVPHPYSRATALRPAQSTTCQLRQWTRSSQCDEGSVNEAHTWSLGFRGSQWEEESVYRILDQSIGYGFSEWDMGSYEFECHEYWTTCGEIRNWGPSMWRQFLHSADWWLLQIIYSVTFQVLPISLYQEPCPGSEGPFSRAFTCSLTSLGSSATS